MFFSARLADFHAANYAMNTASPCSHGYGKRGGSFSPAAKNASGTAKNAVKDMFFAATATI
jgi:hypothetical protein